MLLEQNGAPVGAVALGFTQASRVTSLVASKTEESRHGDPVVDAVERQRAAVLAGSVRVAPEIVPTLPLPEESATLVPDPASNEYAAARLSAAGVAHGVVAALIVDLPDRFPAASNASTASE